MRSFLIFLSSLLLFTNCFSQNYYTENFTTDPGFDSHDQYHYWDSDNGIFKYTVTIGAFDTYASSPEFSTVNIEKDFTVMFHFYAELFEAGEYLIPSISFSSTPNIIDQIFSIQLSSFNDAENFRLGVVDALGNTYFSDVNFYGEKWYTLKINYFASDSSFDILVQSRKNPDYHIWETNGELDLKDSFSYVVLGKEKNIMADGDCVVSIDSIKIYGEVSTSAINRGFNKNMFAIYPNPADESIKLKAKINFGNKCHLELYNLLGKMVFHKEILHEESKLDLNDLRGGLYFLKFFDAEGKNIGTKKLVIKD